MTTASAYEILRGEILQGALAAGERLRVAELNQRYQLGLTPIREALVRLTSEGLVRSEMNKGVRVRAASIDELRDLMRTRREIERLCLKSSMQKGDAAWEADIIHSLYLLTRHPLPVSVQDIDVDTARTWETLHRRFHFSLVAACDSPWLLHIWNMLADHSERYRNLRLLNYRASPLDVDEINIQHQALADAVIARNHDLSIRLIEEHLQHTESVVEQLFEDVT